LGLAILAEFEGEKYLQQIVKDCKRKATQTKFFPVLFILRRKRNLVILVIRLGF
jgi:hypothetical protein